MTAPARIGFLGFGEAARAFRATLAEVWPATEVLAYDIKLDGRDAREMARAMAEARVTTCPRAADLAVADWIFSAVTADQSLIAVAPLLPALGSGHTLIDINSVSPGRKRETAARVAARGAAYVDMAVMTPVHPRGHRSPVLIAGAGIDAALRAAEFDVTRAGQAPGEATAIKMVRSLFVKGLEAITVETLLAAERAGCREAILASLSASYPGLGWPDNVAYTLERTLKHGARRAAEMRESAATLDELGLYGGLAAAIAEMQDRQGRVGGVPDADLTTALARTLAARLDERDDTR